MNYLQKKKIAFMSIVNRVKGFLRTITGALPLTLGGCVDEESITDYKLYGNSVQDGTPAPEAPVEVESVGEKTKNLFDINSATSIHGINSNCTIKKVNGNFVIKRTASASSMGMEFNYPFKAGKYALKIGYLTTNYSPKSSYIMYFADKSICVNASSVGYPNTVKQLNIPEDMTVTIVIYANDDNVVGNECTFSIMLSEGYDSVPYEPFGYKIPITVSGKNLFDINKVTNSWGVVEYNGVQCLKYTDSSQSNQGVFKYTDNFKENTRYTFAVKIYDEGVNKNTMLKFVYTDGSEYSLQIAKMGVVYKYTTSANKTLKYIVAGHAWGINRYIDLTVTQLEEGTTATKYEPYHEPVTTNIYLDEPLRKVGDAADYIDFENGKVVRNVGKYTFTGNETDEGGASNDAACVGYVVYISGLSRTNYKRGLCKHVPVYTETSVRGNSRLAFLKAANHPYCYVFFKKADFPDLTAKQITKQMYDSGNPLVLYYNRNTPRETLITLPNLPTFKGTSIVSANTTTQPSNAEITYYSSVKGG